MSLQNLAQVLGPRFYLDASVNQGPSTLAQDLVPYVTKFEYEDDEAKIDKLTLIVANPGLIWKDDPRWQEGARWRCRFGYLSDISDMKNVVISRARPHFPTSGIPTIEMIAFNLQQDMNRRSNPYNFGAVSSSSIASTIAARYSLDTDIEQSQDARSQARVQPAGSTDIQYLMTLAQKLNWDCYIEGTTLHFHHKRYETPAALTFTYYTDQAGTLLEFEPDVNLHSPTGTGAAGTNTRTGQTGTGSGNGTTATRLVGVDTTAGKLVPGVTTSPVGIPGQTGVTLPSAESNQRVIDLHGMAVAQKVDMSAIKATATMTGSPQIRARTMIRIAGVDQQYCGNWRVAKSRHIIDIHGYKTTVHLRRDAGNAKSSTQNQTGTGAGTPPPNTVGVDANTGKLLPPKGSQADV